MADLRRERNQVSETWFYTNTWSNQITQITVGKFTDSSVWVRGQRNARKTISQLYAPTWDEAHSFLMEHWNAQVLAARRQLEYANGRHGNVKGMKQTPEKETKPAEEWPGQSKYKPGPGGNNL